MTLIDLLAFLCQWHADHDAALAAGAHPAVFTALDARLREPGVYAALGRYRVFIHWAYHHYRPDAPWPRRALAEVDPC